MCKKLTFGSLFAGIGGFDLGLERAGMECKWQIEKDKFCLKVLNKHWPNVPKYEDIYNVKGRELEPVELICGGFPCQPFSFAGRRKSDKDDRYLWPEMLRIIQECKPSWVIGENVPGIINLALDKVLTDLESEGYICWTFIIPACAVNAPHRRDRVWIVGYSNYNGQFTSKKFKGNSKRNEYYEKRTIKTCESQRPNKQSTFMADTSSGRQWEIEPSVGRVADGIPNRVDRLRSLGNAVVPQIVEHIGQLILTHNKSFEGICSLRSHTPQL